MHPARPTFLAVVGFAHIAGLTVIMGLGVMPMLFVGRRWQRRLSPPRKSSTSPGVLRVAPRWAVRYGSDIGRVSTRDPRMELFGTALDLQRSFWKVVGIMTAAT